MRAWERSSDQRVRLRGNCGTAWALGRRVSVTIENADENRLEGAVRVVAGSGAYAVVAGLHVPLERVLAVHRPSRLGDSTVKGGEPWRGPVPRAAKSLPGQDRLAAF